MSDKAVRNMRENPVQRRAWPRRLGKAVAVYLCCIVLTFVVCYGVRCVPRRIQREFTGVELRQNGDDVELMQTTSIRIDGWLRNRPFSYPEYTGTFEIGAYPQFNGEANVLMSKWFSHGSLSYKWTAEPLSSPGVLYTDENMSFVAINLFEVTKAGDGGYLGSTGNRMIVAPAANLSEASNVLLKANIHWMYDYTGYIHVPPDWLAQTVY